MGRNVITVEVTAEDGNTARTYTVTVTRAEPLSADATLSGLTLSGVDFGNFDSATTSYDVKVANGVDQTTVTATANDDGASYVVKLGDAVDEDGTVELSVGANAVSVVVTAEDGEAARTYTVTVTRDAPPSTDATLKGLALSGVTLAFDPATTGYAVSVANDMAETTVIPAVNDDGATYVVKLNGAVDEDGTVELAVGENEIGVVVTAEDGETTLTYTVTVTRAEAPPEPAPTDEPSANRPARRAGQTDRRGDWKGTGAAGLERRGGRGVLPGALLLWQQGLGGASNRWD